MVSYCGNLQSEWGIKVYINGHLAGSNPTPSRLVQAKDIPAIIGRNNRPLPPTDPVRAWATFPSWYSFDGILDEIRVYDTSLSPETIAGNYDKDKTDEIPLLHERKFPTVKPSGRRILLYLHWRCGHAQSVAVAWGWQETIFLNEPGTRPEDNVDLEAVTLANMMWKERAIWLFMCRFNPQKVPLSKSSRLRTRPECSVRLLLHFFGFEN